MADAVFDLGSNRAVLTMVYYDGGTTEVPNLKGVPVLELYNDSGLVEKKYFGPDNPFDTSAAAVSYTASTADTPETIGGAGTTLVVPLDYFKALPENGFDFYASGDAATAPGLKIIIQSDTQLVVSEDPSWNGNEIEVAATVGSTFLDALAKLTPSDADGEASVSAYYPHVATAPTIIVDRNTIDPDGAVEKAFASLNTALNAYYAGDDGAAGSLYALLTESGGTDSAPKSIDVLNALISETGATEGATL
ncbi:hypothetical protein OAA66_05265, partial [Planktomarina temperata]|nr:hypothetical protein [Planktomarina temperata]